jgi:hypothetical protein
MTLKKLRADKDLFVWSIVVVWAVIYGYLAHNRGIWIDEWLHFEQIKWNINEALHSLFIEISPFAPGQLMLGRIFHALTGGFPSIEFSGRLSSVVMCCLTIWLSFRMKLTLLPLATMFSVALVGMATQSRPNSAMILCGAVAFRMLWIKDPLSKGENRIAWFSLFFGHIYGICYVAMGAFFRKDWRKVLAAVAWLGVILYAHIWPQGDLSQIKMPLPGFIELTRQTMGAIGSPHKAWVIHSLLALLGLGLMVRAREWPRLFKVACYFIATVAGPIIVTKVSGYYFMPRVEVGGVFGFLTLSALGAEYLLRQWPKAKLYGEGAYLLLAFIPWILFVMGVPPFIDQPLSKYRQIIETARDTGAKNVLWADSGNRMSISKYGNRIFAENHKPLQMVKLGPYDAEKTCWEKAAVCFYAMYSEELFTTNHVRVINEDPDFFRVVEGTEPRFDLWVYTAPELKIKTRAPALRTY